MKDNLKIPYGVADFKTIRNEKLYYIDKTGYIPLLEQAEEVLQLYADFKGTGAYTDGDPAEWVKTFKPWYDGYCFSKAKIGKESVFNSDMVLYHLSSMVDSGEPPENMVDRFLDDEVTQLHNCEHFVHRLYAPELMSVASVFREIIQEGDVALPVLERFDFAALEDQKVFFSLFYYYGIVTFTRYYQGRNYYGFPNKMTRQVATSKQCATTSPAGWIDIFD